MPYRCRKPITQVCDSMLTYTELYRSKRIYFEFQDDFKYILFLLIPGMFLHNLSLHMQTHVHGQKINDVATCALW